MITVTSVQPLNDNYGAYEGTPIARFYINRYMNEISSKISGLVLEFGLPTYAQYCNCAYEIIDIDAQNQSANIHAGICQQPAPAKYQNRYDYIFCTAVLQLVSDLQAAVTNLHSMLKPGGHLILAEKAISRLDPWVSEIDRWRFTQHGVKMLMKDFSDLQLRVFGNVYAACAYLNGIPAEQLELEKLDYLDPMHPIITIADGKK